MMKMVIYFTQKVSIFQLMLLMNISSIYSENSRSNIWLVTTCLILDLLTNKYTDIYT